MAAVSSVKDVQESVPKINDELALGSDMEFQRRWWRFEHFIWTFFTVLVVADLLGLFGRGPLANAEARTSDGSMVIRYERIERTATPSILRVEFGPAAVHDGKAQLWASESLVKSLGNQRVIPQPDNSVIDKGGILYNFPISSTPATVQFALEPHSPGRFPLTFRIPGGQAQTVQVWVVP